MRCFAAGLRCALTAATASAAPAPSLKVPWVTGWDKPIDPLGDCRFDRKGDRLTITMPGKKERHGAPSALLRDMEGDFMVQVRVVGMFQPPGKNGLQQAGIYVSGGGHFIRFERVVGGHGKAYIAGPISVSHSDAKQPKFVSHYWYHPGPSLDKPAYLRLERRGDTYLFSFSTDRKEWTQRPEVVKLQLPPKVKVGVAAEAWSPGRSRPSFLTSSSRQQRSSGP